MPCVHRRNFMAQEDFIDIEFPILSVNMHHNYTDIEFVYMTVD